MLILRLISLRPKLTAKLQCNHVLARSRPRLLGALVYSKGFWLIGLAALLIALAACTSSSGGVPTSAPGPAGTSTPVPTDAPAPSPTPAPPRAQAKTEAPQSSQAASDPALPDDPTQLMRATIGGNIAAIARKMVASENQSYIPVLLEFLRFQSADEPRSVVASFLNKILEGPDTLIIPPDRINWEWWIEWLGQNPQVQPPEGYAGWKGDLYSLIDPGLGGFLYDGVKTEIRLEEVVWGGVGKDRIPDLRNPPVIAASEADYLEPEDRVFGVSINGEHRAYPLRVLNLHEMANDVVGGVPFALAY